MSPAATRVGWIDLARVAALAGMVVFHLARDLEIFGLVPQGLTLTGGWALFARMVAGSFLFLSGMSLVLAHGAGLRWGAWRRRVLMIAGAAGLVSIATYAAFPQRFVYFGILHSIAAASLIGLAVLRLPAWGLALSGAAVLVLHLTIGRAVFDSVWLAWTGLSRTVRPSLDFLPLVPWLAPFLFGMALARAVDLRALPALPLPVALTWISRHSLSVYLVHQPVLLGVIWAATRLV